jgi:PhnB protein
MATVSTYLNFNRRTEEAFLFYKQVFGGDFLPPGILRMGDAPTAPGAPMSDADKRQVMHVALPIVGGHLLMGSDVPESMHQVVIGTQQYICLDTDTRAETDRLFAALSAGGKVESAPAEMFWGAYFGTCKDRFGIQWMFNTHAKS